LSSEMTRSPFYLFIYWILFVMTILIQLMLRTEAHYCARITACSLSWHLFGPLRTVSS
jgi:hypothetical protein